MEIEMNVRSCEPVGPYTMKVDISEVDFIEMLKRLVEKHPDTAESIFREVGFKGLTGEEYAATLESLGQDLSEFQDDIRETARKLDFLLTYVEEVEIELDAKLVKLNREPEGSRK